MKTSELLRAASCYVQKGYARTPGYAVMRVAEAKGIEDTWRTLLLVSVASNGDHYGSDVETGMFLEFCALYAEDEEEVKEQAESDKDWNRLVAQAAIGIKLSRQSAGLTD